MEWEKFSGKGKKLKEQTGKCKVMHGCSSSKDDLQGQRERMNGIDAN